MLKKYLSVLAVSLLSLGTAQAASIVWGATQNNGFSLFSGAELGPNNLARLGYFDITDSVIQQNAFNLSFLESHFIQVDTARIGDGLAGASSNFATASTRDTSAVVGQQVYMWVFASTNNSSVANSLATAFQHGIFYVDKATDPDWAFPVQSPVPGSSATDVSDLTNLAGTALTGAAAHVVVGDFPKGNSTIGGAPNFGLALVPEPTAAALVAFGVAALGLRRRRS